jgi:hypothetical protein
MMSTKVSLYMLEDESCEPEFEGSMDCCEGNTCSDLHIQLEAAGVIKCPFQFWNNDEKRRIKPKMECLNPVGNKVFVVCSTTARAEIGKRTFDRAFGPSIGLEVPDALGFDNPVILELEPDAITPPNSS